MSKLHQHHVECCRHVYMSLNARTRVPVPVSTLSLCDKTRLPNSYPYFSMGLVAYELTITLDQSKQTWHQAEENSAAVVERIIDESRPWNYMLFLEYHKNGWRHYHGVVWFVEGQASNRWLEKTLKRKVGKCDVTPLRDTPTGMVVEDKKRRLSTTYADWFSYITKDIPKLGNLDHYYSVLGNSHDCKCVTRVTEFMQYAQSPPVNNIDNYCDKIKKNINYFPVN